MVVSRQCAESNRLTALKTVSARIRGAKSDLAELGEDVEEFSGGAEAFSKYAKEIQALTGFDIMKDAATNTYKDIYDIFEGISKAWDDLNDTQRSRVSEILGGTRQLQIISSIIGNWEDATGAYAAAMDSAGAATEAESVWMETAAAHINQFKSAFQEMSSSVVNSDIISLFADLGILILNIINNISKLVDTLGGLKTVLIGITGAIVAAKLPSIITKIGSIGTAISSIINKTVALGIAISSYKANGASGLAAVSSGFKAIGLSISSAQIALSSFTIALTAGIAIFSAWKRHAEETSAAIKQAGEDAASNNKELIKSVNSMNALYEKYKDGSASKEDLTKSTDSLIDALGEERAVVKSLSDSYGDYIGKLNDATSSKISENILLEKDAVEQAGKDLTKAASKYYKGLGIGGAFGWTGSAFKGRGNRFDLNENDIEKWILVAKDFSELELDLDSFAIITNNDFDLTTPDGIVDAYEKIKTMMQRMNEEGLEGSEVYNNLNKTFKALNNAVEEYRDSVADLNSDIVNISVIDYINDSISNEKTYANDNANLIRDTVEYYNSIQKEINDKNIDVSKTMYGNIDTNNRQVLEWTQDNLNKYKDAIESYGLSAEDLSGEISTVLGGYGSFGGVDIAFSPILQTSDGPIPLSKDAVYQYINSLIEKAGDGWTNEQLLKLDAEGLEIDGLKIKNIIADIGDSAANTGEILHYLGEDGALNSSYKAIEDFASNLGISTNDVLENYKSIDSYIEKSADGIPDTMSGFYNLRDKIYNAVEASNSFVGSNKDIYNAIDLVLSKRDDFKKFYDGTANDAAKASASIKALKETISDIESNKKSMKLLGDIYADIVDEGEFDASAAITNDFVNAFGNLDSYEEFLKVIANSPNDIDACSDAIRNLAIEFIKSQIATKELTEENKGYIVTALKSMGVTNAEEAANKALSASEDVLIEKKKREEIVTSTKADASLSDTTATYMAAKASNTLTQELAATLVQKIKLNATQINTSNDIKNLLDLANAANLATSQVEVLANAYDEYRKYEELRNKYKDGDWNRTAAEGLMKRSLANIRRIASGIDITDVKPYDFSDIQVDLGSLPKSSSGSSSSSSSSTKTKAQEAFEKEYARRKHQLEMEEITQKQYLDWLNGAYKKVYKNGTDEYWKYEEEVKKGYRQLEIDAFEKTYDKNNHLVNMEKMTQADYLNWLNGAYKKVYKVGTDEYNKYEEEVFKGLEDLRKRAEDALDKLIDYEVDMLKKGTEKEKDELQNRLDKLKDFYDKQKEMLREQYDEEDYIAEQAKKRKAVTDLQMQISWLSMDNSAAAQKKLAELSQELRDAREDLTEFEKDYALDAAEKMYDDLYEKEEASIQSEIDSLDSMLNSPETYFNRALNDIKDNTKHSAEELYKTMVLYNRMFGDGNDQTVKDMWKEAYDTGVVSLNPSKISIAKTDNLVAPKDVNGDSSINMKDTLQARQILAGMLANDSGLTMKDVLAIRKYLAGLIDESGIPTWMWDYVYAINHGHASGTKSSTAGLHRIFENGPELEFQSSNGNTYRMLGAGDMILPAKATSFLYDFAVAGSKMVGGLTGGSPASIIGAMSGGNRSISVTMSPISIYGNANQQTVSEMRRAQRDALNDTLKAFAKLNK